MKRIRHIIQKEFIQMKRDKRMVRMIIMLPVMQLLLFGYAASFDVRNVPVSVYDGDRSPESRKIITAVGQSEYFNLLPAHNDPRDLEDDLMSGRALVGLNIPYDFSRTMHRGETSQVGVLVDGSDSQFSGVAAAYVAGILREQMVDMQLEYTRRSPGEASGLPGVTAQTRIWFNPTLESRNYILPGVLGLIVVVLTLNLSSLTIVRERETGTLEQLLVTPLSTAELIVGKMIPFLLIGLIDMTLAGAMVLFWFRIPLLGNPLMVYVGAVLLLINILGLGLVISGTSHTQQQAQLVAILVTMPSILLSGFAFPIASMPVAMQYLTCLLPFRYFLVIVRGAFLKDVGMAALWPQFVALIILGAVTLAIGIRAIRKHL